MFEFVMPFFIQNIKDLTAQVDSVKKQTTEIKDKDKKEEEEKANQQLDPHMMMGGFGDIGQPVQNALMAPPGMMPPMGMGQGMPNPGMGGQFQQPPPQMPGNLGGLQGMNNMGGGLGGF